MSESGPQKALLFRIPVALELGVPVNLISLQALAPLNWCYPLMKKSYVSVLISVVKLELAAQKGPEIIF